MWTVLPFKYHKMQTPCKMYIRWALNCSLGLTLTFKSRNPRVQAMVMFFFLLTLAVCMLRCSMETRRNSWFPNQWQIARIYFQFEITLSLPANYSFEPSKEMLEDIFTCFSVGIICCDGIASLLMHTKHPKQQPMKKSYRRGNPVEN